MALADDLKASYLTNNKTGGLLSLTDQMVNLYNFNANEKVEKETNDLLANPNKVMLHIWTRTVKT